MNITIKNLSKQYGPQKAVDNLSFEVKTGEILGFLGPNGAGKSTTMKMITGYLGIGAGTVQFGDQSVVEHGDLIKKHIGYLPENNPLYLDMPVIDYLEFCAALQGVVKEKIQERIRTMVRVCGLNTEKHKKIGELSKGYRQRVGLAQSMIHDPGILILDEPTTGLDAVTLDEVAHRVEKPRRGRKTVVITSNPTWHGVAKQMQSDFSEGVK